VPDLSVASRGPARQNRHRCIIASLQGTQTGCNACNACNA
jgi:hypothetical protein